MTITKAIRHLERKIEQNVFEVDPEALQALKLGMEALKERQEAINQGLPLWHELLPGETK